LQPKNRPENRLQGLKMMRNVAYLNATQQDISATSGFRQVCCHPDGKYSTTIV
jgi:hypothetical protein